VPKIDLFAAQTVVSPETHVSEAAFRATMGRLVRACAARRGDGPALVVFPENVGSFLALSSLGRLGTHVRSTAAAIGLALLRRPGHLARALRVTGPRASAALLAVGNEVRRVWEETFSELAREHGIAIVAGSAMVPDGTASAVYNTALTFDPSGRRVNETRKVHLVPEIEDGLGLARGAAEDLDPVELPVGPVSTLICYDGFAVPHTRREPGFRALGGDVAAEGARIVAHPAANPWPWDGPWVHAEPGHPILRREQWRAEGIETQLRGMDGVRYAITAHLLGEILDQRFDGRSEILERHPDGRVEVVARARAAHPAASSEEVVHARVEAEWL